jgi:hypothetical protein
MVATEFTLVWSHVTHNWILCQIGHMGLTKDHHEWLLFMDVPLWNPLPNCLGTYRSFALENESDLGRTFGQPSAKGTQPALEEKNELMDEIDERTSMAVALSPGMFGVISLFLF